MAFATFAALAIRNAQLMQEAKDSKALLEIQNRNLREEIKFRVGGSELIGESKSITRLKQELEMVAPSDKSVLIQGETGSGKEIVARCIHSHSLCSNKPLIYVNCAAIPESLIESELFGHRRGAFTGASENRAGKFRSAHGGTLFLDEVADLPLSAQPRLLRVLQEGEVTPLGSDQILKVKVRIIAATNKDLLHEVEEGRFRQDLYHRLAVFPIFVSPLSERIDDIPLLVEHFLRKHGPGLGLQNIPLRSEFLEALYKMKWPGNIRELEHFIERSLIWSRKFTHPELNHILVQQLVGKNQHGFSSPLEQRLKPVLDLPPAIGLASLKEATQEFQRYLIEKTLMENQGNQAKTARILGVDRSNLNRKIKLFGIGTDS
jgi:anaerobic nitric oxide reductase transcription regulator